MTTEEDSRAGSSPAHDPHPVSRGSKLQACFMGIDSLYLVVEYPYADVFEYWSSSVSDLHDVKLHEGIPFGSMVLRRGLIGYKLSVWDGDACLLITDRVDDNLKNTTLEGQGMGVMLQLGPEWLRSWGDGDIERLKRSIHGQLITFLVRDPEKYPIRVTRLDFAIDVLGLHTNSLSPGEWGKNWVGYANSMAFYVSTSRELEGLSVGTSSGAVRFKIYDKVRESKKRGKEGFWRSVWGVEEDEEIAVSRFEWSVKCYQAKFAKMRYLSDLSQEGIQALANYLTCKWGRLCVPQPDTNQSRWPLTPLWCDIRTLIGEWSNYYEGLAGRKYDYSLDISPEYLKSAAGWLSGLQVRVGLHERKRSPASFADILEYLQDNGHSIPEISARAREKWTVASRLAGRG